MSGSSFSLLLIEDNPGDARLVREWLRQHQDNHYDVIHVERLAAGFDVARQRAIDVVLLDLSLPDAHGLEALAAFQSTFPHLPIVVLSGSRDDIIALEAVRHGAQDYLAKSPESGYHIERALRYAIERKHAQDELRRAKEGLELRVAERTLSLLDANQRLLQEVDERVRAEYVLQRERDFTNAVLNTVSALVVVLDNHGRVVSINKACEHLTGYTEAEVAGQFVWDCFIPPEQRAEIQQYFGELTQSTLPSRHENQWRTRRGERRLVSWANTVLLDAVGQIEYVIGTGIDITEQRRAEETAWQRHLELAHMARVSTMGSMATEIAHELNQPLFAIGSTAGACLRLLRRAPGSDADVIDGIEQIAAQAERASKVIARIRSFVRKDPLQHAPVALAALVRDVVQLLAHELRTRSVALQLRLPAEELVIQGDTVLLQQVLLNLLRNAIEAMSVLAAERRALSVTVQAAADNVRVCVADSGPGLAPEVRDRLFEPFVTTKSNGMGMGLALCKGILEAHQGRLWAEINTQGGTTFCFSLPWHKNGDR